MTSTQDPVTVFGAKVPVRRGWDDVSGTIRWLASRWSNCTDYRFELVTAGVSGDLAYLVGFDHLANSVNDVQVEPYTLREMVHRARRAACASTAYVCVVDRDFRVGVGVGAAAWLPVWLPIGPIHYESPAQGSRTVSLSATACAGIRR